MVTRDIGYPERRVAHAGTSLPEIPFEGEFIGKLLAADGSVASAESFSVQRSLRVCWICGAGAGSVSPTVLSSHGGHVSQLEIEPHDAVTSSLDVLLDPNRVFDAVVVDISLPEWRGLNLFSRIRSTVADVPVVVVCSADDENLALETIRLGAVDYLLKEELNDRILARVIRSAVERSRLTGELNRLKRHLSANETVSRKVVGRLQEEIALRQETEKRKDDFINTASHEIRSPLAVIQGVIENLKEGVAGPLTYDQSRYVDMAFRHMDRLSKIINNLLDISRLESGKARMHRGRVDASALIRDLAREFQIKADEHGIEIACDIPEGVAPVYADADMLTQVVTNLLSNALKFCRQKITVEMREVDQQNVRGVVQATLLQELIGVQITVSNDGSGIEPKDLAGLFNKYEQFHRAKDSRGHRGTGLGLAICKEIVELHDGKIWAESRPGRGVQFHFVVPKFDEDIVMETVLRRAMSASTEDGSALTVMVLTLANIDELKTALSSSHLDSLYDQIHQELVSTLFRKGDSVHPCLRRSAFAILVQTGRDGAAAVRRRVQSRLEDKFRQQMGDAPPPSFKLGVAIYPDDATDPKPIFARAFESAVAM